MATEVTPTCMMRARSMAVNCWVDPEWLPTIPHSDFGPFYCYILWAKQAKSYYVGHSGNVDARIAAHKSGQVPTTRGNYLSVLWISDPIPRRTNARHFEAALKSYIHSGNEYDFERCTGLFLKWPGHLLEYTD